MIRMHANIQNQGVRLLAYSRTLPAPLQIELSCEANITHFRVTGLMAGIVEFSHRFSVSRGPRIQ